MTARVRRALVVLVPAAAVAFLFREALAGRVLYRRDISMVWLPQVEAFVRVVAGGAWPLWDPWRGFGVPLLADPRAGIFYPPTWLNLVIPPGWFYTAFVVGHLVFSAWGMGQLARRLGASELAAALAATAWVGTGPLLSLASMWHHLAGAAWMPWVFLAAERALDGRDARTAAGWAAAVAAQLLAGSPDYSLLTTLALVPWVALRGGGWAARATTTVLAATLALGLAAAQWVPTVDVARRADRVHQPASEATVWSLHPALLLEAVLPFRAVELPLAPAAVARLLDDREPWLHSIHLGAPIVALGILGALAGGRNRLALAAVAAAAVPLALGSHTPVYGAAVGMVPPLGWLRFPVKVLVPAAFSTALLAGLGFDTWRRSRPSRTGRAAAIAVLAGSAALGAGAAALAFSPEARAAWLHPPPSWSPTRLILWLAGASLTSLATLALVLRGAGKASVWGAIALVVLAAGPPLALHRALHLTAPPLLFQARPPVLEALPDSPAGRLYVEDYTMKFPRGGQRHPSPYHLRVVPRGFSPDAATMLGAQLYLNPPTAGRWGLRGSHDRDILGFDPPWRIAAADFVRAVEGGPEIVRVLRAAGVHHVLALRPAPGIVALPVAAEVPSVFRDPIHVFHVPAPLPRAFLVDGVRVADGPAAEALLASEGFDPAREVLFADGTPQAPLEGPMGTARIAEERADRIAVEVHAARAGWLVLADGYEDGWRARVDGQPVPVVRANVVLRAVPVPPGPHRVEFVYRPPAVAAGLAISLASLLVLAAVWRRSGRGGGAPSAAAVSAPDASAHPGESGR